MSDYDELADLTKKLSLYRFYREQAQTRMDEAVAEESKNIDHESERIISTEARIRELVTELGLVGVTGGAGAAYGAGVAPVDDETKQRPQKGAEQ